LAAHPWPGNVRELQNRIRRAVVIADGDLITAENLELGEGATDRETAMSDGEQRMLTLKEIRQNADRKALEEVLAQVNGNVSQAAKVLGISRPTLYDLMRLHKVKL
jgi:Response regulator containing CheY-like receiver, AAA-type ATPase, and DNA-binding domains